MSSNHNTKANTIFGNCTQGHPRIRGYKPDNSSSLSEMIAGVPVALETGFTIIPAVSIDKFIGILTSNPATIHTYGVVLCGSIVDIVVRCKKESGIVVGDHVTVRDGRFDKGIAGDVLCGIALYDATTVGKDDITTITLLFNGLIGA